MSDDTLAKLKAMHAEVAQAEARVQELSAQRRQMVKDARDSGVTAQALADALGVSRARIYKLMDTKYR